MVCSVCVPRMDIGGESGDGTAPRPHTSLLLKMSRMLTRAREGVVQRALYFIARVIH